jgi:hypothetical protein
MVFQEVNAWLMTPFYFLKVFGSIIMRSHFIHALPRILNMGNAQKNILICYNQPADRNNINRVLMRDLLTGEGYNVTVAEGNWVGLSHLSKPVLGDTPQYDLAIVNWVSPKTAAVRQAGDTVNDLVTFAAEMGMKDRFLIVTPDRLGWLQAQKAGQLGNADGIDVMFTPFANAEFLQMVRGKLSNPVRRVLTLVPAADTLKS